MNHRSLTEGLENQSLGHIVLEYENIENRPTAGPAETLNMQ